MTENNKMNEESLPNDMETSVVKEQSTVAMLPPTDNRPIAIVGMGGSGATDELERVSRSLNQIGLTHVVMSIEDAEAEGITREVLMDSLLSNKVDSDMIRVPNKPKGSSKMQQVFKRKKKGKKTHRKKR